MAIEVKDSFMMGTENGPNGPKHALRYDLWVGGSLLSLYTMEQVVAFAEWVKNSGNYMEDIGQQAFGWVTPSETPHLFSCLKDEQEEFAAIQKDIASGRL